MVRGFFIGLVITIIVVVAGVWMQTAPRSIRNAMVFVGTPTVIVSWEAKESQYVLLVIPSDVQIEALHGYGSYSVASLWKLDMLEKRHGTLFLPTIIENFGLPIGWYSTTNAVVGETNEELVRFISSEMSFFSLLTSVVTRSSSLSFMDAIGVWRATRAIGAGTTRVIDFRSVPIGSVQTQADGSKATQFDAKQYDGIVGDFLEDVTVRTDSLRLAIYNTTEMSGIGSRVARVIEHVGGYVVFVGNDTFSYEGVCELKGSKEHLLSATSMVIQSLYGCVGVETAESMRGDLVLRLGTVFEKRYLPF